MTAPVGGALTRPLLRYRWIVLGAALVIVALAFGFSGGVNNDLINGGYTPADAPSTAADRALTEQFGAGTPSLVLVISAQGSVDAPATVAAGGALESAIRADPRVESVTSYFGTGLADLRSMNGQQALFLVTLRGDDQAVQRAAVALVPTWRAAIAPLRLDVTGDAQVNVEIANQSDRDLIRAELIGAPLTLIILILVFGSVRAAALPVAVGAMAVTITSLVLVGIAQFTDVSVFALNLTTALGFGLAVDYSLLIVSRYREELVAGAEHTEAIVTSLRTAGRTVLFSGLTVATPLCGLFVFPLFFLRSLAYAAICVVLLAALSAVTVLPALLAVLGPRSVLGRRRAATPARITRRGSGRGWAALAHVVMAHPLLTALPVLAFLVLLAVPFGQVRFGVADYRVLPASAPSYRAAVEIGDGFRRDISASMTVLDDHLTGSDPASTLDELAAEVSRLSGVGSVDTDGGTYRLGQLAEPASPASSAMVRGTHGWMRVWPAQDSFDPASRRLVDEVRQLPGSGGLLVAGSTATLVDTVSAIGDRIPVALGLIAGATFILLFLFTGSVLLPVKALVLNLFSLTGSFGAAVFVFQQGHLRWLVGSFTNTGSLEATIPVLIFCIAFGLSMDYEVFLLSRIKEEYVRSGDNTHAVAEGLRRTGQVFTAAALVVAFALGILATSGVTLLKLLGVTIALAIIVDAFLVRSILVPALMKVAGRANWWAPAPLAALHARLVRQVPEPNPTPEPELHLI